MNFGELQQQIASKTKRPDKLAEIATEINDAIRFFSIAATFPHDLVENTLNITPTQYAQNIQISTNFPRFRKIAYLKPNTAKRPLQRIDPLKIFTEIGCEQLNRWYRSGDYIYYKLSVLASTMDYGYYTYPADLVLSTDTHWMLDIITHVIRHKVLGEIYESIGEAADADRYIKKAMAEFLIAKEDLASAETY